MSLSRRLFPLFLLVPAFVALAQPVVTDAPVAWQADAKANKHAQKEAAKLAQAGAPPPAAREGRDGHPPEGRGAGGAGGPPGEGGPDGGGPGEGRGGHGGHGDSPGASGRQVSAAAMLRPEMDFAAPVAGTLVLYRTREAVLFGRPHGSDSVVLPLSGAPVEIAPGVQARLQDQDGQLGLHIQTSNGIQVDYRYTEPEAGVLAVQVKAEGPIPRPGSRFEVERRYARAAAD
ncbi:hypothetical protein [Xanthomonas massiliensis]|uniref:hypothetical protein n=1 Tax=Xanthomonas massiliensis TaxID=1720302 RepID=UPI000826D627|nr:hypothetical protein [Xanthomonas massiliensis]